MYDKTIKPNVFFKLDFSICNLIHPFVHPSKQFLVSLNCGEK